MSSSDEEVTDVGQITGRLSVSDSDIASELARTDSRRLVMDALDVSRAVRRMAHQIIEQNDGCENIVLIAMLKGGAWLAQALAENLNELRPGNSPSDAETQAVGANSVKVGYLDASFFRDDLEIRNVAPSASDIGFEIDGRTVVLVDDVLFTGRSVRAALDSLRSFGRPQRVQLCVMVDRGHRELPIRPDVVGKNLPTSKLENVKATLEGVVIW